MIEFIKKFCTYFAATLTFLLGLKAAIGVAFSWQWVAITGAAVAVLCAVIAWAEVYRGDKEGRRKREPCSDEESVFLTIKRALQNVRFAARDDESIAHQANKVVRRTLDKRCIKYKDYKRWRHKNPFVFTAIIDDRDELIGFFDVFPLTDEAARGLIAGTLDEHGLTLDAILPQEQNASAKKIYIASICLNPKQTAFSRIVAKEVLLLKLGEFLTNAFPPDGQRFLFAYAHTEAGERLLRNAEFRNTALSRDTKQRDPLYELSPDGYAQLASNFKALLKGHLGRSQVSSSKT